MLAAFTNISIYKFFGPHDRDVKLTGDAQQILVSTHDDVSTNCESTGYELIIMRISAYRLIQVRGFHYQRLCHYKAQQSFEIGIETLPKKFLTHPSVFHENLGGKSQLKLALDTRLEDLERRTSLKRA